MAEFRAGGGLFQRSYIRSTAPWRAGHHRITCGGLRCRGGCINKPDRSETVKNGCEAFRMPYNDIRPYSYARRRAANRKVLPPPPKKKIHDWEDVRSSVRFLTRTFRNVFYVRVGKRHVRLWRSQRSRTVVWGGERWDGSWTRPRTQTEPQQRPPRALFSPKLDNSCCYARYSCGNNCNVVVKLVQECKFFNAIYFRSTETVRRERYV